MCSFAAKYDYLYPSQLDLLARIHTHFQSLAVQFYMSIPRKVVNAPSSLSRGIEMAKKKEATAHAHARANLRRGWSTAVCIAATRSLKPSSGQVRAHSQPRCGHKQTFLARCNPARVGPRRRACVRTTYIRLSALTSRLTPLTRSARPFARECLRDGAAAALDGRASYRAAMLRAAQARSSVRVTLFVRKHP